MIDILMLFASTKFVPLSVFYGAVGMNSQSGICYPEAHTSRGTIDGISEPMARLTDKALTRANNV